MKRAIPAVLVVFGLGSAALFAADFWQKKKFPEWDEKEVHRMLFNSPWAHPIELSLGSTGDRQRGRGRGGGGGGAPAGAVPGAEVRSTNIPGGGAGGGGGSWGGSGGGQSDAGSAPGVSVTIRFQSALPVKQAIAKARFGSEALSSPEAVKLVSREEPYYLVGVAGLPPQLIPEDPSTLKDKAVLKIKDKPPIPAQEVRGERGRGLPGLLLLFPRAGHPIVLEDGWVEVQFELRGKVVQRPFSLKDMVYQGKLEM